MSTDKSRADSKRWKNGKNVTIPFAQFQQRLPDPSVGAAAPGLDKAHASPEKGVGDTRPGLLTVKSLKTRFREPLRRAMRAALG